MFYIDIVTYALSKKYTDETAEGFGALKGADCTVKSITENDNNIAVTFEWTGAGGTKETSVMTVPKGEDGVSVSNAYIDENQELIIELSDRTEKNAGKLPVMKNTVDTELSDTSENPVQNKVITSGLDNTVKLRKNYQTLAKEDDDSGGIPMHTITISTNTDKGDMSLSPEGITIRQNSASDTAPAVEIKGDSGITLYNTPIIFGQYRSSDKMKIQDNYIESDDTVNIGTISSSPSLTSRIRFNTQKGSLAMSEVKSTYESSASAAGQNSIAIGSTSKASGDNSVAIGKKSTASGNTSIAIGNANYMGFWTRSTEALGNNSVALGDGVKAGYEKQTAIGSFNDNKSYNIFEVGNGSWIYPSGNYSETLSNAFSVDKSGNVTSGGITVANSGSIDISSNFSISVNSIYPSMAETIIGKFAAIAFNLRNILHRDDKSAYSDIMKDIDTFVFTFKTPYNEYNIHAKRMAVSLRGSSTIDYEYSWMDSFCENKCVVSVAGYNTFTDSTQAVTANVRVSDYAVGVIKGSTENNDGQSGLAPVPHSGESSYVLTGNGQWTPNILQIRKNETVAADSSLAMTIDDTNFYLLSITADTLPQQDLYIISSWQGGGKLDATRLTGDGDNSLYPITRTDDTVLTVTNKLPGSALRCKLYRINFPTIW